MSRTRPIVAIDGPAGAGKSTIARRLAEALDFVLVDTGALYRAVALQAQREGVPWSSEGEVAKVADRLVKEEAITFARDPERGLRVKLAGDDVSEAIRAPDVAMGASAVSAHAGVRAALLDLQRHAGKGGGVVLEGRDIGTVVFPDAERKFFLTAKPEVRAKRRYEELQGKGQKVTLEETLADVLQRDAQDTGRAHAPLRQAEDAILVDSSDMTIDETVRYIAERVQKR